MDLLLNRVREQLRAQQIELEITQDAKDHLVKLGFDADYGARPRQAHHPEHGRGPARGGAAARPVHGRPDDPRRPVAGCGADHRAAAARRPPSRPDAAWRGRRAATSARPAAPARPAGRAGATTVVRGTRSVETILRPGHARSCGSSCGTDGPPTRASGPVPLRDVAATPVGRLSVGSARSTGSWAVGSCPGRLVLLGGEPGIGKSTLVLETAAGVLRQAVRDRARCCTRPARSRRSSSTCAPIAWGWSRDPRVTRVRVLASTDLGGILAAADALAPRLLDRRLGPDADQRRPRRARPGPSARCARPPRAWAPGPTSAARRWSWSAT